MLSDIRRSNRTEKRQAMSRINELDAEIKRLVDAVASVGISPAIAQRLQQAEAQRADLTKDASRPDSESATALIDAVQRYRKMLSNLEHDLSNDPDTARELLRALISPADLIEEGGQMWVETQTGRAAIAVGLSLGSVAGVGLEPTTFGL